MCSILKYQVDICLGAQQMVDILTTKNLNLEEQVRELQEAVDDLVSFIGNDFSCSSRETCFSLQESLCEMNKGKEKDFRRNKIS